MADITLTEDELETLITDAVKQAVSVATTSKDNCGFIKPCKPINDSCTKLPKPTSITATSENKVVGNQHSHAIDQADLKGTKGIVAIATTIIEKDETKVANIPLVNKLIKYASKTDTPPKFDLAYANEIGGYTQGTRLALDSGYITVISTVDSNYTNPNQDMNGWITLEDAEIKDRFIGVNSIEELLKLKVYEGRLVLVNSYYDNPFIPPQVKVSEGGGYFKYISSLSSVNDGGICINGWVRQKSTYNYLTPEMFGAKGIAESFDDYKPIQNMLDAGAKGCTFEFDGSKTYYNAFANDGSYVEPLKRNIWTRDKTATFKFNNCLITRAKPIGDENDTSNTKYTDQDTALLRLKNAEYYLYDKCLDANATLGTFVNTDGSEIATTKNLYYTASVGTYGLHLQSCTKVRMYNVTSNKAYFNMFIDGCKDVKGWGVNLTGAIQAPIKNTAPNDLNFGAGVKVWFSDGVELYGIYGTRNANATVECEKFNKNCVFHGRSEYDYSNSLVIQASKNISLDWRYDKVIGGTGAYINDGGTGTADDYCSGITGKIRGDSVSWCGVLIEMKSACIVDFTDINLDIYTTNSSYCGLSVNNASNNAMINSAKINHISVKDTGTLFSRVFVGAMTGRITGSSNGCTYGLFVRGTNTANTCLTYSLDLRSCDVPYVIDSTSFAEFDNLITKDTSYRISTVTNQSFGVAGVGMNFNNNGVVQFNHFVSKSTAGFNVLPNMTQSSGSEDGRTYIDPSSRVASGDGFVYTVKMYKTT